MFDTLIKGGTLIDGTGAKGVTGDIAIKDGKIAEMGGKISGQATRTIDADGAIVTPGFVDTHSHYDGQVTWDDTIDPSFSNGITTTMVGNCGVGFAPARPADRELMIAVMEGVEAIPGIVLTEGVPWKWQSFPEYMDFLSARNYGVDFGVLAPHAPMRVFAMGERAVSHQLATAQDIDIMTGLVREAMGAGAMGISCARIEEHVYGNAKSNVPGTYAADEEFYALADVMKQHGRGIVQIVPAGAAGDTPLSDTKSREDRKAEHRLITEIAKRSGRPVHYLLPQIHNDLGDWQMMLDETRKANEAGAQVYAHIAARGTGIVSMMDGYNNFSIRPSYMEIAHLPLPERAAAMRDPARRARILAEENLAYGSVPHDDFVGATIMKGLGARGFLIVAGKENFEPTEDQRIVNLAAQRGVSADEIIYDHLAEGNGGNAVAHLLLNYAEGNLDHVYAALDNPYTVSSLGDGGAHMKFISDASMMPMHLTYWARDRRGPKHSLEAMVARITSGTARAMGLDDRGVLAVGKRADINVMDYDRMHLAPYSIAHDLPAGGARMQQGTMGFLATLLNGTVTRENDRDTGARPGRLIRANG